MDNFTMSEIPQAPPLKWSYMSFVLICVGGIILNVGVFWKRKTSRRRQSSTTKLSLSLLCIMAAADTICLIALLFLLSLRYLGITNTMFFSMVCKLDVFIIHAASAFSIWCWLVLSAVRYVAIYRPYAHLRMSNEPHLAVIAIAILCCLFESWLLYDITYVPELRGCESSLHDETLNRKMQILEIILSYFLPLIIITVLDLKVLFCRSVWFSDLAPSQLGVPLSLDSTESDAKSYQSPITCVLFQSGHLISGTTGGKIGGTFDAQCLKRARSKRRAQQLRVLRRCLCITVFDLSMNLPSYLYRLYLNLIDDDQYNQLNPEMLHFIEMGSQLMYFAQFALNALYLVCIIYDTPRNRQSLPISGTNGSSSYPPSRTISKRKDDPFTHKDSGKERFIGPEF